MNIYTKGPLQYNLSTYVIAPNFSRRDPQCSDVSLYVGTKMYHFIAILNMGPFRNLKDSLQSDLTVLSGSYVK